MKQLIILSLIIFMSIHVFSINGQYQPQKSSEKMVENNIKALKKEMTLDQSQTTTIEKALTVFYSDMKKLRSSGQRPDRSKMEGVLKTRNEAVQKVLPDADYKTFLKVMESLRPKKPGKHHKR